MQRKLPLPILSGSSPCTDAPPTRPWEGAGLRPHVPVPGRQKKGDSSKGISPIFRGQNYFAASTVSAAASAAVESACSQQAAVESHFSAQPSQAEASVAAASVAAASAAAFLLAFPPQLTMATAARTMTKEKIFFIASNVLILTLLKRRKDRYSPKKSKEKSKNFQK